MPSTFGEDLLYVPSFLRLPWAGVLIPTDIPGGRGSGKFKELPTAMQPGWDQLRTPVSYTTSQVPPGHRSWGSRLYKMPRRGRNRHASELRRCHRASVQTSQHTAATVTANSEGCGPRRWGDGGCLLHRLIYPTNRYRAPHPQRRARALSTKHGLPRGASSQPSLKSQCSFQHFEGTLF